MRLILATTFVVLFTLPAFAAEVVIPWGDWLGGILGLVAMIAGTIASVLVAWALKFLPATLRAYIDQQRIAQVEQLLQAAITYGVNTVSGATMDKTLNIEVGNAVLAEAIQYAIDHGPAWLINWMGGEDGIRDKIISRLPLDAEAALK